MNLLYLSLLVWVASGVSLGSALLLGRLGWWVCGTCAGAMLLAAASVLAHAQLL